MSPGEAVREKALSLLADDTNGLNPQFAQQCKKRGIALPLPGDDVDQSKPFNFSPDSANVFRMKEAIGWLEANTNQQYPCLIAYVISETQDRGKRPMDTVFFGPVVLEMLFYIAWSQLDQPKDNNFEAHLDALGEALLWVLNSNPGGWEPVLYANMLDIVERKPLEACNNGVLLRRGIRVRLTAKAALFA